MTPTEIFNPSHLLPGLATALISVLLVITKRWHGHCTCDPTNGIQKFHECHTPRVGGIAIFCGLSTAWFLSATTESQPESQLLGNMLIAGIPAFAAGLTEDISKRVGVRMRLFATIISGTIAIILTGYALNRVGIQGIDTLLTYLPLSIAFTIFAVAGMANATNIIDGFNGLAAGTMIICFTALGFIAWQVGDLQLVHICIILALVTAGFIIINYPFGKIFMGDGGAYLLGFMLAWIAVMLPMRNPKVSPWAPFLICSYPFIETTYSIIRRYLNKAAASQPDVSHMHSLIKIKLINELLPQLPKNLRNSMVSPFCWTYVLIPVIIAVTNYNQTPTLIIAWLGTIAIYAIIYTTLTNLDKSHAFQQANIPNPNINTHQSPSAPLQANT